MCTVDCVPGEDGGVHGAAVVINDGEGGAGILGHGHTVPANDMNFVKYWNTTTLYTYHA